QGRDLSTSRPLPGAGRSVEDAVLLFADHREMAHAGRRGIGEEPETVAVRERRHERPRRRRRTLDGGVALTEGPAHSVQRLVDAPLRGAHAPSNVQRVDDPQDLADEPVRSLKAVGNGERVEDADRAEWPLATRLLAPMSLQWSQRRKSGVVLPARGPLV